MEEYGQRALNDTISSYSYVEPWLLLVQNGEQMSELKKKEKIYLLSSGIKVSLLVNLFQE